MADKNLSYHSKYIEPLRDFVELFPKDDLSPTDGWHWGIGEHGGLHLIMENSYNGVNAVAEAHVKLDIEFEGDGVVIFRLRSTLDDTLLVRALYDSHCLDKGEKFRRYFSQLNPASRSFSDKAKQMGIDYYEWYWAEEKDPNFVMKTWDMW